MTSPARSSNTLSPALTPKRLISSKLCKVALEIMTPAQATGSNSATGVKTPVRPTWTMISLMTVRGLVRREFKSHGPAGAFKGKSQLGLLA